MNILIYSDKFLPTIGGSCRVSYELAREFHKLNHNVSVLTVDSKPSGSPDFDRKFPFDVFRCPVYQPHFIRRIFSYRFFRNILIKRKIRIIYILASHYDYLLIKAARKLNIPYVVSIQSPQDLILPVIPPEFIKKFNKRYAGARMFIAIAEKIKINLMKIGVPADKIKYVRIGVNHEHFSPDGGTGDIENKYNLKGKNVILTVARLDINKGQADVINALRSVIKEIPNTVYMIIGEGDYEKKLRSITINSDLEKHIIFTGALDYSELPAYYRSADVCVMPSLSESVGLSYLEAQSCNRPVVGYRGIAEEAVLDGVTGILVKLKSVEELKSSIVGLLSDEGLCQKMGRAARERMIEKFSWEKIGRESVEIMERMLWTKKEKQY